jgi:hypothetical protein
VGVDSEPTKPEPPITGGPDTADDAAATDDADAEGGIDWGEDEDIQILNPMEDVSDTVELTTSVEDDAEEPEASDEAAPDPQVEAGAQFVDLGREIELPPAPVAEGPGIEPIIPASPEQTAADVFVEASPEWVDLPAPAPFVPSVTLAETSPTAAQAQDPHVAGTDPDEPAQRDQRRPHQEDIDLERQAQSDHDDRELVRTPDTEEHPVLAAPMAGGFIARLWGAIRATANRSRRADDEEPFEQRGHRRR